MVDDIGVGIGRQRLGGGRVGGGLGEWRVDRRKRWRWDVRNSSVVGMSSSRVNEVLNFQARLPADLCWRTVVSSLSSLEGKKLDGG